MSSGLQWKSREFSPKFEDERQLLSKSAGFRTKAASAGKGQTANERRPKSFSCVVNGLGECDGFKGRRQKVSKMDKIQTSSELEQNLEPEMKSGTKR